MKYKTCKSCMWWWDLNGTGERRCYRNISPLYNQKTKNGCAKHEDFSKTSKESDCERAKGITRKMRIKEIRELMCDDGWPTVHTKSSRRGEPNPMACVEGESMCLGGVQYLKQMKEEDFRELLCGGDCNTCRQPCNLRRLALMRKIKPIVVRPKAKPRRLSFYDMAMKPYWLRYPERREKHEAASV